MRSGRVVCGALAGILSGCLLLPKSVTKERIVDTRTASTRLSRGRPLIAMHTKGGSIVVKATRNDQCLRRSFEVVKVTQERESKLVNPFATTGAALGAVLFASYSNYSDEEQWKGYAVVLAVPVTATLATNATIAGLQSAPTPRRYSRQAGTETDGCPGPRAGLKVQATFPSGASVKSTTDKRGYARFSIPGQESAEGKVVLRAPSFGEKAFLYGVSGGATTDVAGTSALANPWKGGPLTREEVRAGMKSVRDDLKECGVRHRASGLMTMKIAIEGGLASLRSRGDLSEPLADCLETALRKATFRSAPRVQLKYPVHVGSKKQRRMKARCDSFIGRWRTETDPKKKGRLILKMPDVCRRLVVPGLR